MSTKNFITGVILIISTFIADYFSKLAILKHFSTDSKVIKVTDFFNLTLVYNKGISFGLFNQMKYSGEIFAIIAIIIICFLVYWLKKAATLKEAMALGLIIGGAAGNVVDRFIYPGVVDFLQFHWQEHDWPSFNIADSAICLGVFVLFICSIKSESNKNL